MASRETQTATKAQRMQAVGRFQRHGTVMLCGNAQACSMAMNLLAAIDDHPADGESRAAGPRRSLRA